MTDTIITEPKFIRVFTKQILTSRGEEKQEVVMVHGVPEISVEEKEKEVIQFATSFYELKWSQEEAEDGEELKEPVASTGKFIEDITVIDATILEQARLYGTAFSNGFQNGLEIGAHAMEQTPKPESKLDLGDE